MLVRSHADGSPCSFAGTREDCVHGVGPKLAAVGAVRQPGIGFSHREMSQPIVQDTLVTRRIAGLGLARNIRLYIQRIASETNPPDEPSRFFESGSDCCCRKTWNVVLVESHISDYRNHAPPDKMTLRLFSTYCVSTSLCLTLRFLIASVWPFLRVSLFNETIADAPSPKCSSDFPAMNSNFAFSEVGKNRPVGREPGNQRTNKTSLQGEPSCLGRHGRTRQKKGYQLQRVKTSCKYQTGPRRPAVPVFGVERVSSWASRIPKLPISRKSTTWSRGSRPRRIVSWS